MHERIFDDATTRLATPSTRRRALRLLGGGLTGGFAIAAIREGGEAKRSRRKGRRGVSPTMERGGRVT